MHEAQYQPRFTLRSVRISHGVETGEHLEWLAAKDNCHPDVPVAVADAVLCLCLIEELQAVPSCTS
eukprot:2232146-Amphidinium_carterae.1